MPRSPSRLAVLAALAPLLLAAGPALAAGGEASLDGRVLGLAWAIPFAGLLLSIALGPLLFPHVWEHHQGKIAAAWALLVAVPLALSFGSRIALDALLHALVLDYVPFILLLLALFTAAGGIVVKGNLHGTPLVNSAILLTGAVLASFIGTTGASIVMIRPLIRANDDRKYRVHTVVFFIFLVSNIGGALTPLGDPPLFLGFLRGVDFFWTTRHMMAETLFVGGLVLAAFFALDSYLFAKGGGHGVFPDPTPDSPLRLGGLVNLALIGVIIAAILISAAAPRTVAFTLGTAEVEWRNLLRDLAFVGVTLASLRLTPRALREANGFTWGPILEVAKLFAGIFVAIAPVLAMLKAGREGAFAPLVALVTNPDGSANNAAYFWMTGALSSFLDNAPTYLVFFELAGGDPQVLMNQGALTLAAISSGAVYMGANSYIGNAPNFMVYAIARERGVPMPSFFGYMAWSGAVLIPVFVLATWVFFR